MEEEILITDGNIEIIKQKLEKLYETFSLDVSENEISIGDDEIYIEFPDETDFIVYSIAEFLEYTENIDSIVKSNESTVRSSRIVQTIVDLNQYLLDYLEIEDNKVENENYTISLIRNPFLIGLITTKERIFDEDYGITPCSIYTVAEIIYKNEASILDAETEIRLIKEFLFYLSHKYNTPISIGKFITFDQYNIDENFDFEEEPIVADNIEITKISHDKLLSYSSLMDMFVEAMSIGNEEIKFLYYYKIIEYCAPIVSKIT